MIKELVLMILLSISTALAPSQQKVEIKPTSTPNIVIISTETPTEIPTEKPTVTEEPETTEKPEPTEEPAVIYKAAGTVQASSSKGLLIDFPCTISEIVVSEGKEVAKGQVILRLNLDSYYSKIKSLEGQVIQNKSKLNSYKSNETAKTNLVSEINSLNLSINGKISIINNNLDPKLQSFIKDLDFQKNQFSEIDISLKNKITELSRNFSSQLQTDINKQKEILNKVSIQIEGSYSSIDNRRVELNGELYQLKVQKANKEKELKNIGNLPDPNIVQLKKTIANLQYQLNSLKSKLNKSYIKNGNVICDLNKAIVENINVTNGFKVANYVHAVSLGSAEALKIIAQLPSKIKNVAVDSVYKMTIDGTEISLNVRVVNINDRQLTLEPEQSNENLKPNSKITIEFMENKN